MERRSDKHGPRVDDAMEHEIDGLLKGGGETRAEEGREKEGPADGEPIASDVTGPADIVITHREFDQTTADARTELARRLQPSRFPTDRRGLLDAAREEHAPDHVLYLLDTLPADVEFATVNEVWETLGMPSEGRHTHTNAGEDETSGAEPGAPQPAEGGVGTAEAATGPDVAAIADEQAAGASQGGRGRIE